MQATGRWRLPVAGAAIGRAGPDDLDQAAAILEDAGGWVASLGIDAWPAGTFVHSDGRGRAELVEALRLGGLYIAVIGQEAAATVSLFAVDDVFWPGAPQDALYLHKLAVRRRFAGLGLGRALVEWSADRAEAEGKRFLRLDCPRDDPRLRRYYERAGFVHRGDVKVRSFHASLYERPLLGPST